MKRARTNQRGNGEDGDELAIEHCLWAAGQRLRPEEVMASVGRAPPPMHRVTWHDAQRMLTMAWNALQEEP